MRDVFKDLSLHSVLAPTLTQFRRCAACGEEIPPTAPGGVCLSCTWAEALGVGHSGSAQAEMTLSDLFGPNPVRERIGEYELWGLIARGGMGVVYRARRQGQEKEVALKLLLGGNHASEEFKTRFRRECETVSKLQHPGIVQLLEVGEHQGQLYFTMEYVAGPDLKRLTRGEPLPPERAARYALQVAEAVDYAHGLSVLHRDLKPSNVLIGPDDRPRITDFGLARGGGDEASLTLTGTTLGTPGYIPPEQISPKWGRVGPWSDVYSVGAILFYLLTGRPPFFGGTVMDGLRETLESEPVDPVRLNPLVPPDLAHICLKCLEKDAKRRYATAGGLAKDLRRFLNAETVLARPRGRLALGIKLFRRHKVALLLGALALAGLVLALALSIGALLREREARRFADAQATQSRVVSEFLREVFEGVSPELAAGKDTELLRGILDRNAERMDSHFSHEPSAGAEMREAFGVAYYRLGQFRRSAEMHRVGLELRRSLFGSEHVAVADSLYGLGTALWQLNELDEACVRLKECLEIRSRLLGETNRFTLWASGSLGAVLVVQGRLAEAEEIARQVLVATRKSAGGADCQLAGALGSLGHVIARQGRNEEALVLLRQCLEMERQIHGDAHVHVAQGTMVVARCAREGGWLDEAESLAREAIRISERTYPSDHPDRGFALGELAEGLIARERFQEAEPLLKEVLAIHLKTYGDGHPHAVKARQNLGLVSGKLGRAAEPSPADPSGR